MNKIIDYMHCYGRTLSELQTDVMSHIQVGGWQPLGGVFRWDGYQHLGDEDLPRLPSLWQAMVLFGDDKTCPHCGEILN